MKKWSIIYKVEVFCAIECTKVQILLTLCSAMHRLLAKHQDKYMDKHQVDLLILETRVQ
jgi:hypothetical protein